jgi:hypothetical protein
MTKRRGRVELLSAVRDEPTVRGILAIMFVSIFAFFLVSSIILGGLSLFMQLEGGVAQAKEIIVTISGIFSGPLGLVIGYYFRSEVEKQTPTPTA